jgi:hypothetical protein
LEEGPLAIKNSYTPPLPESEERRSKVLRELKLALVGQRETRSAGFNPYDAEQGRGRQEPWEKRRR